MIQVPPLVVNMSFPKGRVRHVLRQGAEIQILEREEVRITSRTTLPILHLANDERVLVTSRPSIARPVNVDGIKGLSADIHSAGQTTPETGKYPVRYRSIWQAAES